LFALLLHVLFWRFSSLQWHVYFMNETSLSVICCSMSVIWCGTQGRNYRTCTSCHAGGGPADPGCPSRLPENIFFTVRPCSISGVYGFALFDEFVGTDPLDRACFAHNILDCLGCRKIFLRGGWEDGAPSPIFPNFRNCPKRVEL